MRSTIKQVSAAAGVSVTTVSRVLNNEPYVKPDTRRRVKAWASNLFDVQASQKALVGSSLNLRFLDDARTSGIRGRVTF